MSERQDHFQEHGYILLSDAMGSDLVERLRTAMAPMVQRLANGEISACRIQTILSREHFDRAFIDYLNLPILTEAACEVLGTDDIMFAGLAVLLGSDQKKLCKWHRDVDECSSELPAMLKYPMLSIQTACAVYDDDALWIVPGSHKRPTTPEERAYSELFSERGSLVEWPDAMAIDPQAPGAMPGSMNIRLKAGDCLLYNALLWHAAVYRPDHVRATLTGGWKDPAMVPKFRLMCWGLTHNTWLQDADYIGDLGPRLGPQLDRYFEVVAQCGENDPTYVRGE